MKIDCGRVCLGNLGSGATDGVSSVVSSTPDHQIIVAQLLLASGSVNVESIQLSIHLRGLKQLESDCSSGNLLQLEI